MKRLNCLSNDSAPNAGPIKVLPFKPRGKAIKTFKPLYNIIPVLERNDYRIIRTNKVSTRELEVYATKGVVLVIIPGAVIFVPKPLKVVA